MKANRLQVGGASYRREWSTSSAQRIIPERNPPMSPVFHPSGNDAYRGSRIRLHVFVLPVGQQRLRKS